jgi:hypothetical protein
MWTLLVSGGVGVGATVAKVTAVEAATGVRTEVATAATGVAGVGTLPTADEEAGPVRHPLLQGSAVAAAVVTRFVAPTEGPTGAPPEGPSVATGAAGAAGRPPLSSHWCRVCWAVPCRRRVRWVRQVSWAVAVPAAGAVEATVELFVAAESKGVVAAAGVVVAAAVAMEAGLGEGEDLRAVVLVRHPQCSGARRLERV